jgi:hypothetical protein
VQVKALAAALAVLMLASGCATTYHPVDGNVHRGLDECQAVHQYDQPEACAPMQTVVDGNAVVAVAWLVLWTAMIVLMAVGR